MEALIALIGIVVVMGLVILYDTFSYGFLLYKYWGWFILTAFPTVPHITFYQCVGIYLVINLFKNHDISDKSINGTKIKTEANWGVVILIPWFSLLIGYFIHLFL